MTLTFEEFVDRVKKVWNEKMRSIGYTDVGFFEYTIGRSCFSAYFSRWNPKLSRKEYTLNLLYEEGSGFELNETFADLTNIPEEYGDMHDPERDWEQPPMFIYGTYKTFGKALQSLLEGDSLNLRPYKELYY